MGIDTRMSADFLSVALCGALLLLLILLVSRQRLKSSLDRIPGPRQYFLGNYLNILSVADKRKTLKVVTKWCREFGPITKVGFGPLSVVLLSSPEYIQKLYGSTREEHFPKSTFVYDVIKPVPWFDGIFHSKGEKWRSRRKVINPLFKYTALLGYTPVFNECGTRLVSKLETLFEDSSTPRPISTTLLDSLLETICKATFGLDFTVESNLRHKFDTKASLQVTKRFLEIAQIRVLQPLFANEFLFSLHPLSRELKKIYDFSRNLIHQLTEDIQLQGEATEGKSLLKDLLDAGLPNEGIYEEAMTILIGGYETTAGTLHSLLFFLALHPEIQEKVREEVDSVFQGGATCVDGNISTSGVKSLTYLEQCIRETLRIVPLFPIYMRQLSGPLTIDDIELPAGTTVGVALPAIQMNPEYYPNPEKFDPDRMSAEMRKERHPYSYMTFSAGPRKCIGSKFAMMESLIVAAHILRHFKVRTTDKYEDVVWLLKITLTPETPMKFIFEKRTEIFSE